MRRDGCITSCAPLQHCAPAAPAATVHATPAVQGARGDARYVPGPRGITTWLSADRRAAEAAMNDLEKNTQISSRIELNKRDNNTFPKRCRAVTLHNLKRRRPRCPDRPRNRPPSVVARRAICPDIACICPIASSAWPWSSALQQCRAAAPRGRRRPRPTRPFRCRVLRAALVWHGQHGVLPRRPLERSSGISYQEFGRRGANGRSAGQRTDCGPRPRAARNGCARPARGAHVSGARASAGPRSATGRGRGRPACAKRGGHRTAAWAPASACNPIQKSSPTGRPRARSRLCTGKIGGCV